MKKVYSDATAAVAGVMKDGIFVWFNRNGAHPQ